MNVKGLIEIEVLLGSEIKETISEAIKQAAPDRLARFKFNGVSITVAADSNPELIYRDWDRGLSGCLGKDPEVGPYPPKVLPKSDLARDAEIMAGKALEREKLVAKWEAEKQTKKAELQGALNSCEPILLSDQNAWNKFVEANKSSYGSRCVEFAEDWARLMQRQMAGGYLISECADEMSDLANYDGITGFMFGAASATLRQHWAHKDGFIKWRERVSG